MKNLLILLSLTFYSLEAFAQALNGVSVIRDFESKETLKSIYTDFLVDLHNQIQSQKIRISTDPGLKHYLDKQELDELFHDTDFIEILNEETFEFEVRPYPVEYLGTSWTSIRFELQYIQVRINDVRSFYIPNSFKSRMNTISLKMMEDFQSNNGLELISQRTLEEYGTYFMDGIETKFYESLKDGRTKGWKPGFNGPEKEEINPGMYDSLFAQEYLIMSDTSDEYISIRSTFDASQVYGIAFFYTLSSDKKGYHLKISHFAPCHAPMEMEGNYDCFPMVWGDEKSFWPQLDDVEVFFMQKLLEQKLHRSLSSNGTF